MKRTRRIFAILLSLTIALSCSSNALAGEVKPTGAEPSALTAIGRAVDNYILGPIHDVLFAALQGILVARAEARRAMNLPQQPSPTVEEYLAAEHPYIYKGTDGETTGRGWCGGYASESIIPPEWRCDANGKSDPEGWCMKESHPTGGYQSKVTKIYTDQRMHLVMLSNHTDGNGNGVDDLMLFFSVDGVGVTAGTTKKIRAAVEQALQPVGVTADDILVCNVSASHCHNALDTQGMNAGILLKKIFLTPFERYDRSMDEVMEKTLIDKAAACAAQAFESSEDGTLRFVETDKISGVGDKLDCGALRKNYFSCFLFEGVSGEKTILANLGAHPTSYWKNRGMLFSDYPYFMWLAMRDAGYNFAFVQSAQANINGPGIDVDEARAKEAALWMRGYALMRDDWEVRYGKSYTDKYFEGDSKISEAEFEGDYESGYKLAHYILDATQSAKAVSPKVEVRSRQSLLKLENGLMAMGCISGLLGEDTVRCKGAEFGYGVMVETNYIALGDDVVILTAPGELSPALLFGTDPDYTGDFSWTGKASWSGKDWTYDTIENIVRKATGDADKTVLLFGITNDALGYIYPDVCGTNSFLAPMIFYNCPARNRSDMSNSMLLTTGRTSGSQIMDALTAVIEAK